MDLYDGLNTSDSTLFPTIEGIVFICLLISGTVPLILCLFKKANRKNETHLLPIYDTETNKNITSNYSNIKLRVNVMETPRPFLNI